MNKILTNRLIEITQCTFLEVFLLRINKVVQFLSVQKPLLHFLNIKILQVYQHLLVEDSEQPRFQQVLTIKMFLVDFLLLILFLLNLQLDVQHMKLYCFKVLPHLLILLPNLLILLEIWKHQVIMLKLILIFLTKQVLMLLMKLNQDLSLVIDLN